jgi:2-dehydro-3-deoxyphosphogluconate aldolase / (4S)-4-hydroxy-2-oxoglutarate aldolase
VRPSLPSKQSSYIELKKFCEGTYMTHITIDTIASTRIVAVVRFEHYEEPVQLAKALIAGGIRAIEFTFTGDNAAEAIAAVRRELDGDACVGAGTVLRPDEAEEALAAGAQFVVTPAVRPTIMAICRQKGIPGVCGALTPTEVLEASETGADLIKIFPARLGGPAHIRDLLGPFPQLRLIPTGGITLENARKYLDAGATAIGIGGNLLPAELIARRDWEQVSAAARTAVAAIK